MFLSVSLSESEEILSNSPVSNKYLNSSSLNNSLFDKSAVNGIEFLD